MIEDFINLLRYKWKKTKPDRNYEHLGSSENEYDQSEEIDERIW